MSTSVGVYRIRWPTLYTDTLGPGFRALAFYLVLILW
jgi:hypothetical protein